MVTIVLASPPLSEKRCPDLLLARRFPMSITRFIHPVCIRKGSEKLRPQIGDIRGMRSLNLDEINVDMALRARLLS